MDEQTIRSEYIERPDDQVKLLCSYTTKRESFLDILLSKTLLIVWYPQRNLDIALQYLAIS